jgi:ABC-type glycerol-3-phosphate transport system substrate-binding protein
MAFSYKVATDKDSHFTGAIAQNASEEENIVLPAALAGVNGDARGTIRAIAVLSDQALDWQLVFCSKDVFTDADLDVDSCIVTYAFTASADALQIGGSGPYHYFKDGLALPYVDEDYSGELHVALVNRSVTGKNAGATGEVVVKIFIEPSDNTNI